MEIIQQLDFFSGKFTRIPIKKVGNDLVQIRKISRREKVKLVKFQSISMGKVISNSILLASCLRRGDF